MNHLSNFRFSLVYVRLILLILLLGFSSIASSAVGVRLCTGSIGDYVWLDKNHNGIQDDEDGISGVVLTLTDGDGNVFTTTTDQNGAYLFEGRCEGSYQIVVDETTLPSGYEASKTLEGDDRKIDSNENPEENIYLSTDFDEDLSIDFGYHEPSQPGCNISVDKTCSVAPHENLLCNDKISATTLRYIGPSRESVTVTFEGKDGGYAEYTNVDLVSGVTVLAQNGYTIDAGVGVELGSKTNIYINGDLEIIHTSCSAIYSAGQSAPLDGNSPNSSTGVKGEPSPNWSVVNFRDKSDAFVDSSPQVEKDNCEVQFGGADVAYQYRIKNIGTTDVNILSIIDNKMPDPLLEPPSLLPLPSGEQITLSRTSFIDETTTNGVIVKAVSGTNHCSADDIVTVTIAPAPVSCKEIKDLTELTMIWNGADGTTATTAAGQVFEDLQKGNRITFTVDKDIYGNDFALYLTAAGGVTSTSLFHLSCSDPDMDGSDDCGKDQGDGKNNTDPDSNLWLLDGMSGNNGSFECALDDPDVVTDSSKSAQPSAANIVSAAEPTVSKNEFKWKLKNTGSNRAYITEVAVSWPDAQGHIKELKFGRNKLLKGKKLKKAKAPGHTFTRINYEKGKKKRGLKAHQEREFKIKFSKRYDKDELSDYRVKITFDTGDEVTFN